MAFKDIFYATDGAVATITMNRPAYRNALGYRMLDEIDEAFTVAGKDKAIRVVVLRGAGGTFSSGHDLGTPEALEYRKNLGAEPGTIEAYDQFKKYNLDVHLRWRNFPKPTIAMVEGYCIYAGWMTAACCDIVFAASNAEFLAGFVEYMSIPWDIGIRRAKERHPGARRLRRQPCDRSLPDRHLDLLGRRQRRMDEPQHSPGARYRHLAERSHHDLPARRQLFDRAGRHPRHRRRQ